MTKPRFNFIDALIILFVALCVAVGGAFVVSRKENASGNENAVTCEYKVQFTQAQRSLGELFTQAAENGETVWVSEKERAEAALVAVEVTPAKTLTTDSENERILAAKSPDLCDITVTLRSFGNETDEKITAGSVALHVGEEISVKGKGIAGYGYITELNLVD